MNYVRGQLSILTALALLLATPTANTASEFQRLLRNPKSFDGKRVTLVGLAEIGGSEFFLYPDIRSAKQGKNAIFVDAHILNENPYEKFDKHWLKITGTVDMGLRPPLGASDPSIVLKRLEVLPRPALRDDSIRGVFQNSTRQTLYIKMPTPTGYDYAMRIARGRATEPSIISDGEITANNESGETIAKGTLSSKAIPNEYFDSTGRTFYFRITNGSVRPVLPREAKNWRK